jgi:hypothetical protein
MGPSRSSRALETWLGLVTVIVATMGYLLASPQLSVISLVTGAIGYGIVLARARG